MPHKNINLIISLTLALQLSACSGNNGSAGDLGDWLTSFFSSDTDKEVSDHELPVEETQLSNNTKATTESDPSPKQDQDKAEDTPDETQQGVVTVEIKSSGYFDSDQFTTTLESLALKEYSTLKNQGTAANFVASPTSTFLIAGMLDISASGQSKEDIREGLGWNDQVFSFGTWLAGFDDNNFSVANASWGQTDYKFSDDYLNTISNEFDASFTRLDFLHLEANTRYDIESWLPASFVHPESVIDTSLKTLDYKTRFVFANKVDMANTWDADQELEVIQGLWQDGETQERLPMVKWQGKFRRFDSETFRSVEIPLNNGATTLTALMPTNGSYSKVEDNLFMVLTELDDNMQEVDMDFLLPEFTIDTPGLASSIIPSGKLPSISVESFCPPTVTDCTAFYLSGTAENADYSAVNNEGFLLRKAITAQSSLTLSKTNIIGKAATVAILEGTAFEPNYLVSQPGRYNLNSHPSGFSAVSMTSAAYPSTLEGCTSVYEADGPTQARPFIFVIKDATSGNILQLGRVKSLDGEQAGTEVCQSEKREYKDNIWPLANATTDTSHSNTNEFTANTDNLNITIDEPETIVRDLFNKDIFKSYASQDNGNFLLSPASSAYAYYMMRFGADDDSFREEFIALGMESDRDTLIAALGLSAPQSIAKENTFWVQSDYEINTDYLNLLTGNFLSEMKTADFYKNHTEQQTMISDWAVQYIDQEIQMSNFIGERTRFVFGSAFSTSIQNIGQSTIGTFAQENQIIQNIPMLAISGTHPYFENDILKAIEIRQTEVNTDLLVIMPAQGQFNTVDADLATILNQIDNNLSEQEITFKLPHFSLNQHDDIDFNSLKPYANASAIRPMLALSQFTRGSLKLNGLGVEAQSYSLSTLLVPTDHGGIGRAFYGFYYAYPSFATCISENPIPAIDARPFIVVLRDRESGIVLQIGRVTDLNYEPIECSIITMPVEPIYPDPLPLAITP